MNDVVRKYSFRDHSRSQPDAPHPGDRLDTEFDQIYRELARVQKLMVVSLDIEGNILPDSLGLDAFKEDVFGLVIRDLQERGAKATVKADAAAVLASQAARSVLDERLAAEIARRGAEVAASSVHERIQRLQALAQALGEGAQKAERSAIVSARSEASVLTSASQALVAEDMAYRWAEKTDGPVVLAEGDPVDDGMFSAKWWAIRAEMAASNLVAADILFVNASGDSMSGPLVLSGDPVEDLEAAPKQYVDSRIVSMSQAEYDALPVKDPEVLYVIIP